jgi:hypothetical protein
VEAAHSEDKKGRQYMAGQNTAVYGIYSDREHVERGIDILRAAGFRNTDISVLFQENEGTKDFAVEKGTKAPEGTAAGAGAIVGGAVGWLVGIGALAIPGLGPFIAAGPIMATLAGVGAGGVVGGLLGALAGLGIPEYEAKRYEGLIRRGGILISVHCDNSDWVKRAKNILRETGAENIASAGEASADFAKGDRPTARRVARAVDTRARVDTSGRLDTLPPPPPAAVVPATPVRPVETTVRDTANPLQTGRPPDDHTRS